MAEFNSETFRYLTGQDPHEETVTQVLKKLQKSPEIIRFNQQDWNTLREKMPQLHRFIEIASFEAAPSDPIVREAVSAALLGMVVLQQEIGLYKAEHEMADLFDNQFSDNAESIPS